MKFKYTWEIIIPIAVGAILTSAGFFIPPNAEIKIVLFCTSTITLGIIFLRLSAIKIEEKVDSNAKRIEGKVDSISKRIEDILPISDGSFASIYREYLPKASEIVNNGIMIPGTYFFDLWCDSLYKTEFHYGGFSINNQWATKHVEKGKLLEKFKMDSGTQVERVFILPEGKIPGTWKKEIERQEQVLSSVKTIKKKGFAKWQTSIGSFSEHKNP